MKTFSDEVRELQDKNFAENIATAKLIICANIKHDAMLGAEVGGSNLPADGAPKGCRRVVPDSQRKKS